MKKQHFTPALWEIQQYHNICLGSCAGYFWNMLLYLKDYSISRAANCFPQREWQMSLRNIWASDDRRKICCWAPAESLTFAGGIPIISAAVSWHLKHRANAFSGLAHWLNKRRTSNVYSKTTFTQSPSLSALFNFQNHPKSDVKYSECL